MTALKTGCDVGHSNLRDEDPEKKDERGNALSVTADRSMTAAAAGGFSP
jgi:hypothetical protein